MSTPAPAAKSRSSRALRNIRRWFGPAMARPSIREAIRASFGAGLALGICGLLLIAFGHATGAQDVTGLLLIAPLGATTFLLFAVPNSPLAQPWSAIIGNTASAIVSVTAVLSGIPELAAIALAITFSLMVMALLRAMHPPGAAVALATVLSADLVHQLGYWFVLAPVMLDTTLLVLIAIVYNRLTGRKYPFRQPAPTNPHGTQDQPAQRRLGLSDAALADILDRFRLSANIGTEDFGRLLAEAETEAARLHVDGLTCADIMSKDVATITPETRLRDVADTFRKHRFKTLPVVDAERRLIGLVTQNDLIQRAQEEALHHQATFASSLSRLLTRRSAPTLAREIMTPPEESVSPQEGIGILVRLLADGGVQAVPVLEEERLAGIVTRSDLLEALARMPLWTLDK